VSSEKAASLFLSVDPGSIVEGSGQRKHWGRYHGPDDMAQLSLRTKMISFSFMWKKVDTYGFFDKATPVKAVGDGKGEGEGEIPFSLD
jgi:hypothetical protein